MNASLTALIVFGCLVEGFSALPAEVH